MQLRFPVQLDVGLKWEDDSVSPCLFPLMLGVLGALSSQGCIVAARRISFITKAVSSFAKSQHSVWTSLDHVPTADAQQKEEQTDSAQDTCSTPEVGNLRTHRFWRLVRAKGTLVVPGPSCKRSELDTGVVFAIFSSCVALQEGEIKVSKDSYALYFLLCEIQIIIL